MRLPWTITLPIAVDSRKIVFSGRAKPTWDNNFILKDYNLEITSATGTLCNLQIPANQQDYSCEAYVTTESAIDVTYKVTSTTWGSHEITAQVPANSFNTSSNFTKPLELPITGLKLSGTVTDDNPDTPILLENASVKVVETGSEALTNTQGQYSLPYLLYDNNAMTVPLTIKVSAIALSTSLVNTNSFNITLTPQTLNTVTQDFVANKRSVSLQTQLTNAFVADVLIPSSQITYTLDGATICETYRNNQGYYNSCNYVTTEGSPLEIAYTASGAWGSDSGILSIPYEELLPVGKSGKVTANLSLHATTGQIQGKLTDDQSSPIANATIAITGDSSGSTNTDTNGDYSWAFVPTTALTEANLNLKATYGTAALQDDFTATIPLVANNLASITKDLSVAKRSFGSVPYLPW